MSDDKTIVCRCEDLTLRDLRALIARGYTTIDEIKRVSRCGMGPCQGKTCRDLVLGELVRSSTESPQNIRMPRVRPLFRPVKLGAIADGKEHEK